MALHLVIILDCSGSMREGFQFSSDEDMSRADEVSSVAVKIDEAKRQLLKLIYEDEKHSISKVTIIPFASNVREPILTWTSDENISVVERFLNEIQAGGGTNLFLALSRAFSLEDSSSIIHYQLITDGLSQSAEQDIQLISNLPDSVRDRIFGILIDLPGEGEAHLKKLVKFPYYLKRVTGQKDFQQQMALAGERSYVLGKIDSIVRKQRSLLQLFSSLAIPNSVLQQLIQDIKLDENFFQEYSQHVIRSQTDLDEIYSFLNQAQLKIDVHEELLQAFERFTEQAKAIKVSIALPKLLSKRFSSFMFISVYPQELIENAIKELETQVQQINTKMKDYGIKDHDSDLKIGMKVKIRGECIGVVFSEPVVVEIKDKVNTTSLLAKPGDQCVVGKQLGKLSISDVDSGIELFSMPVELNVVDFLFGRVSRPFVYNLAAAFSGSGALLMFILTLFGQIDTTFGLTSGTTAGLFAVTLYLRFTSLFQRLHDAPFNS